MTGQVLIPGSVHGAVAEWLGRALQKLLQRFESAQRLEEKGLKVIAFGPFLFLGGAK